MSEEFIEDSNWLMRVGAIEEEPEEEREYEHVTIVNTQPETEFTYNPFTDNGIVDDVNTTNTYAYTDGMDRRVVTEESQTDVTRNIRLQQFEYLKNNIMRILEDPRISARQIQIVLNELVAFGELDHFSLEHNVFEYNDVLFLRKGQFSVRLTTDIQMRERRL